MVIVSCSALRIVVSCSAPRTVVSCSTPRMMMSCSAPRMTVLPERMQDLSACFPKALTSIFSYQTSGTSPE